MEKILNNLAHTATFSTDEIMPILEQKISSIKKEEYEIDFFITNCTGPSDKLEVNYYAIPKEISDFYLKTAFIYNGFLYTCTKLNPKNHCYKKDLASNYVLEDLNFKRIILEQFDDYILIGKEIISVDNVYKYLLAPHNEEYHLFNDFFQYDESLDELTETIENFAKQKVHTII